MATLIACANGNFTSSATWQACDTVFTLNSEGNLATLTTSYVSGTTNKVPGAITIDGIAVKVRTRAAVPSGTMSVNVRNFTAGADVAGTEVTINVADIPRADLNSNGWIFLKFASPVLLLAATNYRIQAKTSVATQVTLYLDAGGTQWSNLTRTTTTAAPGAGDNAFILGEWTAAGTKTNRSVTMDSTATTDYGAASTTVAGFGVGVGGTLTYGNTAATNYVLRLSALFSVWAGGVFSIPTMPRDSTAILEFDCAADGDFGLFQVWGTVSLLGQSRTSGKNIVSCLLNTDEAIASTSLGVDTDTGWLSGDIIGIASTTTTPTQAEERTLNGNATATDIAITAGLTNAHLGTVTNGLQAEVLLLTRNVIIRSTLSTAMSFVQCQASAAFTAAWVDFRYIGTPSTGKGLSFGQLTASGGTISVTFCLFRDSEVGAIVFDAAHTLGATLTDCTFWKVGTAGNGIVIESGATGAIAFTRCVWVGATAFSSSAAQLDLASGALTALTVTDCRISSYGTDGIICFSTTLSSCAILITGTVIHGVATGTSSSPAAIYVGSFRGAIIRNCRLWRNGGSAAAGIVFAGDAVDPLVDSCTIFGNTRAGISLEGSVYGLVLRACALAGDTTTGQPYGLVAAATSISMVGLRIENSSLGVAAGIFVAHSTADLGKLSAGVALFDITVVDSVLGSTTEINATLTSQAIYRSSIARQRKDAVTNTHETVIPRLGTIAYNASVFRTAAPSQALTPSGAIATERLKSMPKRLPVASGQAIGVSVFARKSSLYTGSAPRLVLRANPAIGIDVETVLDTLSVGADTWEQLTGTMASAATEAGAIEVFVDCDGSAGVVYLDDWSPVLT